MEKLRHVIWDWNGTLLNDVSLSIEIFNSLLTERKLNVVDRESYREHYGMPIRSYYVHLGIDLQREDFESVGSEFLRRYEARVHECLLHRGVTETFESLTKHGVSHSILSAHPERELERALSRYEIQRAFQKIYGSRHIAGGDKLARGGELLADLGLAPEECVLIGDTTSDGMLAEKLGTRCVLLAHGHHSRSRLESLGVPVLDDFSDPRLMDVIFS